MHTFVYICMHTCVSDLPGANRRRFGFTEGKKICLSVRTYWLLLLALIRGWFLAPVVAISVCTPVNPL